jgi:hypothetical protein
MTEQVVQTGQGIQTGTTYSAPVPQQQNATGGGQQPETVTEAPKQPEKVFTQSELDATIGERLSRERAKYKDYESLKDAAAKWAKHEEAQKSEEQKTKEALEAAKRERDEVLQRAQSRLIRAAFIAEAARAGVAHPEDVYALADLAGITLDDSDEVLGVQEAVKAVVDAGRVPLLSTVGQQAQRPTPPAMNAAAGVGQRPEATPSDALTDQELGVARRLGLTPEQYAASKKAIKDSRR